MRNNEIFHKAFLAVLACPRCGGRLSVGQNATVVSCGNCTRVYPVVDQIPVLFDAESSHQEAERVFRDAHASGYLALTDDELWATVRRHHCVPVMRTRVAQFQRGLAADDWILDIGVGFGWHWAGSHSAPGVIGVDMSLGNLRIAKRFLGEESRILLICADAARLPIQPRSIAAVWSVQTFQHFPDETLRRACAEVRRVLGKGYVVELYNLNPAWLQRAIYRLAGRSLHTRGRTQDMELNLRPAEEWTRIARGCFGEGATITSRYSELFFHPNLGLRPRRYPVRLEAMVAKLLPWLVAICARQVEVRVLDAERGHEQ